MNERFEGIVLFKRSHREHDGLVKIFTDQYGTKMFFVRGLAKGNHRLLAHTVPLTTHQFIGDIQADGLSFLKEGQTLEFYALVQQDMIVQAYAAYIAQLVDASIEDNQPDIALYRLFRQALRSLQAGMAPEVVTAYMEIHLLARFGTYIQWNQCSICGNSLEPYVFSISEQGMLCAEHHQVDARHLPISARTLHVAALLASTPLTAIQNVTLSAKTLQELRELMDEIYQEFVGIRLKSRSYLEQLLGFQTKWTLKRSANRKELE